MQEPKRLFDLDAIGRPPKEPVHPRCGGALIRVNRDGYDAITRTCGVAWATERDEVPVDERVPARVRCENLAMSKMGVAGRLVFYAHCANCAGLEMRNREAERQRLEREGHR